MKTQKEKVIEYFIDTGNEPKHFKQVSKDLDILVPNMRRILGQGTLKGEFKRVSKGTYIYIFKYCRKCTECNNGMNEGYIINDNYYCSDECRRKLMTDKEWNEHYDDDGDDYWTTWYDEPKEDYIYN